MITSSEWLNWVKRISVAVPKDIEVQENENNFVTSEPYKDGDYRLDKKEFLRLKKHPFFVCFIDSCFKGNPIWAAYIFESKGKLFTLFLDLDTEGLELNVFFEYYDKEKVRYFGAGYEDEFEDKVFHFIQDAINGLLKRHPERLRVLFEKNGTVNDEVLQEKLDEIKEKESTYR